MTSGNKLSRSNPSNLIIIRQAPANWDEDLVTRKFSQYGSIEDVTFQTPHPNSSVKSQSVIVEFADIDDAAAAVEDNSTTGEEYSVHFYTEPSGRSLYVLVDKAPPASIKTELVPCSNSNCTNQLIVQGDKYYCASDCYSECVDMMGRVNIYEKFIASMGRSGSGLLDDLTKLENVVVTVDRDGIRSSLFFPPKK